MRVASEITGGDPRGLKIWKPAAYLTPGNRSLSAPQPQVAFRAEHGSGQVSQAGQPMCTNLGIVEQLCIGR